MMEAESLILEPARLAQAAVMMVGSGCLLAVLRSARNSAHAAAAIHWSGHAALSSRVLGQEDEVHHQFLP